MGRSTKPLRKRAAPKAGTVNPLQGLVRARMAELGMSLRDVEAAADGMLSYATVGTIAKGTNTNPSDRVIDGLSLALDIEPDVLRAAAAAANDNVRYDLPPRVHTLSEEGWRALLSYADWLLAQERSHTE